MRIETNNLLKSSNKNITFVNSCLYAKEGPNCAGKMDLSSMMINYDSFFSSNMTLQPEDKDTPIMYGFLGTEITFIAIIPHFNMNPQQCPDDNYIEYYFEDQPLIRRTFTDVLMLSGNDTHRIPQMYLYNPTKEIVNLEIMIGNVDINKISTQLVPDYTDLIGLSYNSVVTDQMYGTACTGSTQFEIYDPLSISGTTGTTQMIIPYAKIDIIEIKDNNIIIKTTSDEPIKLTFLSKFNALQVFSKMNWVIEDSNERYITMSYPAIDVESPVITFIPTTQISTLPIIKSDITWRYIDTVIDNRDGVINNSDVNIIITNNITGEQLDMIEEDGNYTLSFIISDLAGNTTSETKQLLVDSTAPTIFFNDVDDIMDLTGSTQTPGIITDIDINRHYIQKVFDEVDGVIANSGVTVIVTSGGTPIGDITQIGDYEILFVVSDTSGNMTNEMKQLQIVESSIPDIHFNPVFSGPSGNLSAFTMSLSSDTAIPVSGITVEDIRDYSISGVTDAYDGIIAIDNVLVVSIPDFPILSVGIYDITFSVSDVSGNEKIENKKLIVII